MPPGVRADFVSRRDDSADQLRAAVGYPAEGEEGRGGAMACEQIKEEVGVPFDPTGLGIPGGARQDPVEGADLEVFFDVNGEEVDRTHVAI